LELKNASVGATNNKDTKKLQVPWKMPFFSLKNQKVSRNTKSFKDKVLEAQKTLGKCQKIRSENQPQIPRKFSE
jgi:hypothetical protein